ncbi:MAG: hypothetical protein AAF986_02925 [Pseudomonadota bacterium]
MFFRRKNRDQEEDLGLDTSSKAADEAVTVEGTAPGLVEAADQAGLDAGDSAVGTAIVAPSGDAIRLFPGFERDDFEVGFRADQGEPTLVMRWKDGAAEWFPVPPLFNRGVLAAMDERDSATDLNRLLRNYGYDVDAIAD